MITDVLNRYGKLGVEGLQDAVHPLSATGKTERSIHYDLSHKGTVYTLRFLARQFFSAMETGRGPRKVSSYGGFDKGLEEYLDARGLPSKVSKSGVKYWKIKDSWVSAKSLAHKINKEGDATYRAGGRTIYSPFLDKLVQELKREVARDYIHSSLTRMKNAFRNQQA